MAKRSYAFVVAWRVITRINATRRIKHTVHNAKKKVTSKKLAGKTLILLKGPDQAKKTEETEGEAEAETGGKRRKADHQPLQTTEQEQGRPVTQESQIPSQMSKRDQGLDQEGKKSIVKWSGAGTSTRRYLRDIIAKTTLP